MVPTATTPPRPRWPCGSLGWTLCLALLAVQLAGCAAHRLERPQPPGMVQKGLASWYGPGFHGRRTASGEVFDKHAMTAAHRDLPLGTLIAVKNLENGRQTEVRINDRGPFAKRRILDLSYGAAKVLEMVRAGVARVELRVLRLGASLPGEAFTAAYTVQVGAFRDPVNAASLLESLVSDFPATEVRSDATLHRVQVGRFAAQAEAEELCAKLKQRGFAAFVVPLPAS